MRTPTITQTASELTVSRGRAVVYGFTLATNNAAVNAIFYDGVSSADKEVLRLYGAAQTSTSIMLPKPMVFERGIHIKPSATTAFAAVVWDSYIEDRGG